MGLFEKARYADVGGSTAAKKPFKVRAKHMGTFALVNYDRASELLQRLDVEESERKSRQP